MDNSNEADRALIRSEIERMSGEHEFAGGAMDRINEMTRDYKVPHDACNTYMVTLKLLEKFEDDLHIHVHLENNILYPAALRLAGN
jgi:regulator of cell morphogenesis and NO signaling